MQRINSHYLQVCVNDIGERGQWILNYRCQNIETFIKSAPVNSEDTKNQICDNFFHRHKSILMKLLPDLELHPQNKTSTINICQNLFWNSILFWFRGSFLYLKKKLLPVVLCWRHIFKFCKNFFDLRVILYNSVIPKKYP